MRWYFDFISPYAYLQGTQLDKFASRGDSVKCVPVLFAGLLKHWGNVGPPEIAPKRHWTFRNVTWLAHHHNIPFSLPPHHPFNPLPLLRLSVVLGNELAVVQRLFRFVWDEGHVPQDEKAFTSLLEEYSPSAEALETQEVKDTLWSNGEEAISNNIFGVPTIVIGSELFWGYEATEMALASYDKTAWPSAALEKATALPEGKHRIRKRVTEPRMNDQPIDLADPVEPR